LASSSYFSVSFGGTLSSKAASIRSKSVSLFFSALLSLSLHQFSTAQPR
jgi:hypothetical protein